jgi:hypothetical protein
MAKTFAPPRSHTLPAVIPSLEPGVPSHPQGSSANPSAPEATPVTERVQLQAPAVGEEEQDDFSAEFERLAEEVAFDREALARNSPASPRSPLPGATSVLPRTSTSPP